MKIKFLAIKFLARQFTDFADTVPVHDTTPSLSC
jgi:hypothetical protein